MPSPQLLPATLAYSQTINDCSTSTKLERCCIILGRAWVSSKMHLKCPHRHVRAICPAGLLYGYTGHGLSFTVKPWASKGIPAMYEWSCQALTWSKPRHRTFCLSLAACLAGVTRSSQTRTMVQKVSCRVCCQRIQLKSSSLSLSFTPNLQSGSSPSRSFSRLSWSTRRGHAIIVKY